ncbi:MAG: hypoxanthine phosphoribosyltransferase [Polyangiales bacterium]
MTATSWYQRAMNDIRTMIDAETIQQRVAEMGKEVTEAYRDRELVLVIVLKGSFMFAADLMRHIDLPLTVDFLGLRSYEGTETSGVVQITSDLTKPIENKDVIVVEDIVDTGLTMAYLMENFSTRHPRSVRLASLLHKPARTRIPIEIHHLGFTIDDEFVVGYGLDYEQKYRNLPYLGVIDGDG